MNMDPVVMVAAGSFILSLAVGYGIWSYARPWIVRQELFAIRDALWDEARSQGLLADPGYMEARTEINRYIACAPYLTMPTLVFAFVRSKQKLQARPQRQPHAMPKFAQEATKEAFLLVTRYAVLGTASGWMSLPVAVGVLLGVVGRDRVERLLDSVIKGLGDDPRLSPHLH